MTYELREHQESAIELLKKSFSSGHRCPVLQAPTGMGKTLIAVDVIKSALAKGKRVLFVVDRITLIEQTSSEFDLHGLDHGIIQSDHWRYRPSKNLQLASVQTLSRRKELPDIDLIIVDECHSTYKTMTKLITETWNHLPFIGLSATPFTRGLGLIYDDLLVVETTQSLIDKGHLADFVAYGAKPVNLKGVKTIAGDYNQKELGKRVNTTKIVGDVVQTWLKRGEQRQTVCFAAGVPHSKAIVDEFMAHGISAMHIDAFTDSEDREEIMGRYESGEIKILSNVGITTKGWNSPKTSCAILARPTKSLMLFIQMVGRVLRTAEGKSDALILDHGGNIERLGFPTDQLPEFLCNGDKDESSKKKEKKEPLPAACEKCFYISTEFICPKCAHAPEVKPKVVAEKGELKKLEQISRGDKAMWYGMLKGYARQHGYKDGWAYHKYHEKFDVYPTRTKVTAAITPNQDVLNFIKHRQIANAKRKKPVIECKSCKSDFLIRVEGAPPHAAALECGKCGAWQKWIGKAELGDYS